MPYLMTSRRSMGAYYPRRSTPRQRLRGLRGLGQTASTITPQAAWQQALQVTNFPNQNPSVINNQTTLAKIYSIIQAGQFDTAWVSPNCSGIIQKSGAATDLSLTQAVGSIAAAGTATAGAALTPSAAAIAAGASTAASVALAGVTLGIGIVVAVLSIIFAHHAAAVAQEQQIECTATAAANNAMNVLAEGVASGQIAPADAVTALNTLYSQYAQMVKPSFGTSPWCNANCFLQVVMKAIVLYWQAQYQAMADAATAAAAQAAANPASAAVQSVATSTGLPGWAIWALGGFLLYELVS